MGKRLGQGRQPGVVAYMRVSTEQQAERETIAAQRHAVQRYIEQTGLTLAAVFEDDGISGATPFDERPGGSALLEAARAGATAFDAVVVTYLDRVGRDLTEALLAWRELERLGIRLIAINQSFDDTAAGRMLAQQLMVFAEFERKMIAARTSSGRKRRVRDGMLYQASVVPYGYRRVDKLLELDPVTAPIVGQMFEWCVNGLGAQAIATRLDDAGVPPPLASHPTRRGRFGWSQGTISKLLHAPRYKGENMYAGDTPMACPPLVDTDTWELAQAAISRRAWMALRGTKRPAPLRRMLFCRACGSPYTAETHGSDTTKTVYSCYQRRRFGPKVGHAGVTWNLRSDDVEPRVLGALQSLLDDPEQAAHHVEISTEQYLGDLDASEERYGALRGRSGQLDEEERRVRLMFQKGYSDEEALTLGLAVIRSERRALERELGEMQGVMRRLGDMRAEARAFIEWVESLSPPVRLEELDADERRHALESLVAKVWVEPDGGITLEGVVSGSQQR